MQRDEIFLYIGENIMKIHHISSFQKYVIHPVPTVTSKSIQLVAFLSWKIILRKSVKVAGIVDFILMIISIHTKILHRQKYI